ncbi:hypothetical protein ACFQMH_37605 [Streptomyces viridiviolaceus]|uniref:Uncharacterized protein n=1 Tax=Streptomyces viridiviolaceus TaxID=68282 RepID=A0ABW2EB15_9ACTN|nr:hypothetical protein [Streptomyces viridiviolaceus]
MPVGGLIPHATDEAADLVVRNAKIQTGDPRLPQAEAVALHGGDIAAVGGDKDVVGGAHLHVVRGGLNSVPDLRRNGVRSLRQGLAMRRDQAAQTPKGQGAGAGRLVGQVVHRASAAHLCLHFLAS